MKIKQKKEKSMKPIYVTKPTIPNLDDYIRELESIWKSERLTNNGEKHQQLEACLTHYLDAKNLLLFTNGHLALETILDALEINGEVITTPFSFPSTTHAIVRQGMAPVFCDIKLDDYTIDPDQIESLITKKTSAILAVHVYGNICEAEKIQEIADRYHLKVIYDAAHAFGVKHPRHTVSNLGDASMYSFHATKVYHTIEGGAVTCNDTELREKLMLLKNFGIKDQETVVSVGMNAKMNEFQAAMGICNLRNVDRDIALRKLVYFRYIERLSGTSGLKLPQIKDGVESNFAYFPIILEEGKEARDVIFERLKKNQIFARKYFYPLISDYDCYKDKYDSKRTPTAQWVSDRVLTLPLYPELSLDIVDEICDSIIR